MNAAMDKGTQVRLLYDPGRKGLLTGKMRPLGAGRVKYQVQFSDGYKYVPEEQLERVADEDGDLVDWLARGRVGRARDLRQALTHERLTGRLADLIYSMEVTNTDFYAYQFKPVLKMLNAPSQGLLIADEVGLGKTIEAGLIWTELRTRFDMSRLFVLCPAMLREKWRRELLHRFGVEADILNAHEALKRLKEAALPGRRRRFAIIASMQGLRPSKNSAASQDLYDYLDERAGAEAPLIDLLIVDETHYLKNRKSKTAKLGRVLRWNADYVALLSATPIHLGSNDLFEILHLLDEDTFNFPGMFDRILEANAPLIEARDLVLDGRTDARVINETLDRAQRHPLLNQSRQLKALRSDAITDNALADMEYRSRLAYRLEEVNLLSNTVTRTRKRDVNEWRVVREPVPEEIVMSEPERQFYEQVTRFVRAYCARHNTLEGFLLVAPQRQMSSSMPAALRSWQRRSAQMEDMQEQLYEDFHKDTRVTSSPGRLMQALFSEVEKLGDLDALWANDSKYARLLEMLGTYLNENPAEKVIVFSYFRATLHYLHERLAEDGYDSVRLMGGAEYDTDSIIDTFRKPGGPRILLSSEVASEGVDLQFCRVLVNYDLPWNPMKIEQRIGRIDRLGQRADSILIWNLFYGDTIDSRIYHRLYQRLKIFEYALGGIEPILGEAMRKLTAELMQDQLTSDQEEKRIHQTALALANRQQQEEKLENEASHLMAHGDYILNQVQASRRLNRWVTGEDLQRYVTDHLELHYPGCTLRQPDSDEPVFEVSLSIKAKHELEQFIKSERLSIPTRLIHGGSQPVLCRFENRLADPGRGLQEVINHFHPLVRFISHQRKASGDTAQQALVVRLNHENIPELEHPDVFVFAIQQWSVQGLQQQEKLFYSALRLKDHEQLDDEMAERLVVRAAQDGTDWLEAPNQVDFNQAAELAHDSLTYSEQQYDAYVQHLRNKNEDLADVQKETLEKQLNSQRQRLTEIRDDMLQKASKPGLESQQKQRLENLAKAREEQIRKLEDRFERRLLGIEDSRKLRTENKDVAVGVIKVYAATGQAG